MTTDPIGSTEVDLRDYCCCDPAAGGCAHPVADHTGSAGRCVAGCRCQRFRPHPAGCMHQTAEPAPTS